MGRQNRKNLVKQVIQPANANTGANVGANPNSDGSDRNPAKVAESKAPSKKRTKRKKQSDGKRRFDFKAAELQAASCQSVYIKKSDITTIITIGGHLLGKFLCNGILPLVYSTVPCNGILGSWITVWQLHI